MDNSVNLGSSDSHYSYTIYLIHPIKQFNNPHINHHFLNFSPSFALDLLRFFKYMHLLDLPVRITYPSIRGKELIKDKIWKDRHFNWGNF